MSTDRLQEMIAEFKELTAQSDVKAQEVSGWGVDLHLHHCSIGMAVILKALKESAPPAPAATFSIRKLIVFATGRIPRGRAKAPKMSRPDPEVLPEDIHKLLAEVEMLLKEAQDFDAESWFEHPYFGVLKRDQTLKFLVIHNQHHLRIVRDIIAAA